MAGDRILDLDLVREYSERQRSDAERILMLADALANALKEIEDLKKKPAAAGPAPTPTQGKRNEQDRKD